MDMKSFYAYKCKKITLNSSRTAFLNHNYTFGNVSGCFCAPWIRMPLLSVTCLRPTFLLFHCCGSIVFWPLLRIPTASQDVPRILSLRPTLLLCVAKWDYVQFRRPRQKQMRLCVSWCCPRDRICLWWCEFGYYAGSRSSTRTLSSAYSVRGGKFLYRL